MSTMSAWSELSDTKINRMVAEVVDHCSEFGYGWVDGRDGEYQYMTESGADWRLPLPDYCNDPIYSWDLVRHYKISIIVCGFDWLAFTQHDSKFKHVDPNPLRAAMITFLQLKGVTIDE